MKKQFKLSKYNNQVDFTEYEPLKPMEAIKAHCKECYCWELSEMKQCDIVTCPFNQFLINNFKTRKRNITDERRQQMKEHMNNIRVNKLNEET